MKAADPAIRKRLFVGLLTVAAVLMLLTALRYFPSAEAAQKPRLGLMTTLPLIWADGDIGASIDVNATPSPVHDRLAGEYEIIPVDDLASLATNKVDVLLLAQPRALAPQEMVRIDAWIRRGGKALILADPALQWESSLSIGDKRRPLFTSLLSPLFSHWGLELVLPVDEKEKLVTRDVGEAVIQTSTAGEWVARRADAGASCSIKAGSLVADCEIGQGKAILVADADFIDGSYWEGRGVRALSGSDDFGNIRWLTYLLHMLQSTKGSYGIFWEISDGASESFGNMPHIGMFRRRKRHCLNKNLANIG